MEKTRQEINDLKHGWNADPCWDIEDTEGFENHKDELLIHRLKMEKQWNEAYNREMQDYASKIGTGSIKLAQHIMSLEQKIEKLEERLNEKS